MDKVSVYKLDSKGKQRIWTIWVKKYNFDGLVHFTATADEVVHPDNEMASIFIESGLVDGKKVLEEISITKGKNIGKVNATTPYSQAVLQAKAKLELKLRGEYVEKLDEVSQGVLRGGISAPMLAQKYDPKGIQKNSKTLEKMKIKGQLIHVQPKFDGNRCLIKVDADSVELYTRKGDAMLPIPHIEEQIRATYNKIFDGQDSRELVLDGELFSSEISFNTLNGLLRKEDKSDEQKEQLLKIDYHLYDVMTGDNYALRYELIKPFASADVHVVPSYEIVATDENIKEKLEEFLAEGHEGLMIRTLDKGYENKRSWQLVKVKLFEDEEFEVVGIETDAMGRLGKFIMKLKEPVLDRDGKTVTTFKAGTTGTSHEEGRQILANKDSYIGKIGTVEFFGKSEYGIPRFPKFKGLRSDV